MSRRSVLPVLVVALGLSACRHNDETATYIVDISHAKTDEGFINSSRYVEGQVIVWNRETGFADVLPDLSLPFVADGYSRSKLKVGSLSGLAVSAGLAKPVPVSLKSDVSQDLAIELADNIRGRDVREAFTSFSAAINQRIADGDESIRRTWFLEDAVKPDSQIRYIVVRRTLRADRGRIVANRGAVVNGELKLANLEIGEAGIQLKGYDKVEFEGENVPVLARYYILKAFRNAKGNYDFEIDRQVGNKAEVLIPILRKL